ncbi:peptidyl-tRNA hydrolase PTH2-domain-containing protein [Armillaria novae-zelandiae]|uniref:peptidyl-tRNA hydrolase n=1 Tax=Armillaria novae-zelandiae TaxID=153914 RepID=A0AA39T987_9AGAR|nr:peptidyl-tRNA hydrolase PTH2-domain-containing protein [Armillaria novae-zelandiae]
MSRSPIIIFLGLGVASGALGFFVGYLRRRLDDNQTVLEPEPENEEDIPDGDLSAVSARFLEPCKLVLVVRTDLKMDSGKIFAQCGDATLACYKALVKKNPSLVGHWERTGQAKIALKASSEEQILELEAIAKSLNLCARSIKDQGTTAVLGIGPAPVKLVNEVTGKLRLL